VNLETVLVGVATLFLSLSSYDVIHSDGWLDGDMLDAASDYIMIILC
jgi:hypothetical protein